MNASQQAMTHIINAMRVRRITIAELCEKVDIGETTFWRYKTGKTQIPYDTLVEIGTAVGMTPEDIDKNLNPLSPSNPTPGDGGEAGAGGQQNGSVILALLRAWKETGEATKTLDPSILADGMSEQERAAIISEGRQAIQSLEIVLRLLETP